MTTGSYLEHYLTLLAWIINNGIWNTLVSTGLFAAALGAIIVSEWMDARAQGADEGNKGVLSVLRSENRLYVAYIVIIFACVPLLPLDITQLKFDSTRSNECGRNVVAPEQTGWGKAFDQIGNKSGKVPLWWALVHALSKGVTASATAAIPCYPDIRSVVMEIDESRIDDKALLAEIGAFKHSCYEEAASRLNRSVFSESMTPKQYHDIGWIGSKYFLNTPGYYDAIQAENPLKNWPYDPKRDAGKGNVDRGPRANAGGYPFCKNWWNDKDRGLRERIKNTVTPETWTNVKRLIHWNSADEAEEETLRQLIRPSRLQRTQDIADFIAWDERTFGNTGNHSRGNKQITVKMAADFGAFLKGISFFPSMHALRTALPMIQAFLIMGIIISLPLIMVLSTYSLKGVMMTSFGLLTLHMLSFWWELARWLDSTLIKALYENPYYGISAAPGMLSSESFSATILRMTAATMFLLLPGLFFMAMSWAGYALGRGMEGVMGNASQAASQAGSTGGDTIKDAGKSVLTRGLKK